MIKIAKTLHIKTNIRKKTNSIVNK